MENNQNQVPEIRQFPEWNSTDTFEITGHELHLLSRFMEQANGAVFAYQNIINRGLLAGTVKLKFEKLSADGQSYEPMSDEEAAPHQAQVEAVLQQARDIAAQTKEEIKMQKDLEESQKDLPRIDAIVDATGQAAQDKLIV